MAFSFGPRSLLKMIGVHPDLVKVMKRAIAISPIDMTVLEGKRTVKQQVKNVAHGVSQTMDSYHIPYKRDGLAHAIDIVPLINGKVTYAWPVYYKLAKVIKQAAKDVGVSVEWGGDWRSFKDGPHWQLPRSKYPK